MFLFLNVGKTKVYQNDFITDQGIFISYENCLNTEGMNFFHMIIFFPYCVLSLLEARLHDSYTGP